METTPIKQEENSSFLRKSVLKTSSRKFHNDSKADKNDNHSSVFNFDLKRVSSQILDDHEGIKVNNNVKYSEENEKNMPIKMSSIKNSFEDIPLNFLRRQSSISKSARLIYTKRKKSYVATKEYQRPEEEPGNEEAITKKRLLLRQRRSKDYLFYLENYFKKNLYIY